MSTLDAVICTRDRPDDLSRCLASLAAQTEQPSRVIVVDGGASAPTSWPSLSLTTLRTKAGLTRQRNAGLSESTAELLAFLDDDVELEPGFFAAVRSFLAAHPECAGVGGNILNDVPRHRASRAFRAIFCLADDDGLLRPSGDAVYLYHPKQPTRVDFLSGSNMVFRREAIEGLEFDERLAGYAYMEDVDFCLRAARRGELWALPEARLLHYKSATARVPLRGYVAQVFGNGAYLFAKHRRALGLKTTAYARRVVGRMIGYLLLALARRSIEPLLGTIEGVSRVPSMLIQGSRSATR